MRVGSRKVGKRKLKGISIWALAFGCVVGWGAFVMPGTIFLPEAGPIGTVIGVLIAAVFSLIICSNYSWMLRHFPENGGSYEFTRSILGEDHAFLVAWSLVLAYMALMWSNATALVLVGRYVMKDALQWGPHYSVANYDVYVGEVLILVVFVLVLGIITTYFRRLADVVRVVLGITTLVLVVCLSLIVIHRLGMEAILTHPFTKGNSLGTQILNIAVLGPYMYVGFEIVGHTADEVGFPIKRIFVYAGLAIVAGAAVYCLLVFTAAAGELQDYHSWREYIADLNYVSRKDELPVFYNVYKVLGDWGIGLATIAVVSAIVTGVMGFHRAASHMIFRMAKVELLPKSFAKTDERGVPVKANLVVLVTALLMSLAGRTVISWGADVSTLSVSIVYGYISLCVILRAKKNRWQRFCGVLGVFASTLVFGTLLMPNALSINGLTVEAYFVLILWSFFGMLYYWYVFAIDKKNRFGKSTIMWMVMLFLLCFSSNVWNKERLQKHIERITGAANPNLSKLLFAGSLEQMLLIVAALFIVYSLFSKVLKREKELSHQVIDAEERNRAKTSFLSSMSHDIRTPMNAIIGFTDLALLDLDNREKVEEYLKKIKGSSAHLLSLINDVLEMSRIESGKIELVEESMNMGELLKEVKDILLGQVAEKNQSLLVSLEDMTRKTVKCDRLRMNQVILNLASNAIKYTPEGGDISIVFRQLNVVDAEHVRCELRVKDNGIGMSEEFACKIFEAFERERTSTMSGVQGTGLGMAITKSIVDLMGGTIEVKTELGKGTEIIVHLTLALAEPESVKKAGEELSTEHFKGKRILLVDDMLINRQLASAVLRLYGISVEEAKDGSEAVEMVKEAEAGYYDLVLMDIQMPKMDGYEAARHIRALEDSEKSSVPILALTANAFQEDKKLGAKAGMNGHVSKPIVRKQLIEELYEIWK